MNDAWMVWAWSVVLRALDLAFMTMGAGMVVALLAWAVWVLVSGGSRRGR